MHYYEEFSGYSLVAYARPTQTSLRSSYVKVISTNVHLHELVDRYEVSISQMTMDCFLSRSVSCVQRCLCPWISLRVSLTFIEVSSEPAQSFLQLIGLLIFFSFLVALYSNSVVPQGVLVLIFTNVGDLCSCSNKTTTSSSVVVKEVV